MQPVWETLVKSQADSETIEQAIARLLAVHDADAQAHLEELASLDAHRTNEIVDHLAESVVNDKLKTNARKYVAIVDPNSESDFDTIDAALAYANTKGGGDILITRGTHYISAAMALIPTISLYGFGHGETIIKDDNGGSNQLYFTNVGTDVYTYLYVDVDPADQSIIRSFDDSPFNSVAQVGMYVYDDQAVPAAFRQITAINGGNEAILDSPCAAVMEEWEMWCGWTLQATNNNNTVTLNGGVKASDIGIVPGAKITITGQAGAKTIISVTDDNIIVCDSVYTGTTGMHDFQITYDKNAGQAIEGITFDGQTSRILMSCTNAIAGVTFTDVELKGVGQLVYSPTTYPNNMKFIDCIFSCDSSAWAVYIGKSYFEGCLFLPTENGAKALDAIDHTVMIDCRFDDNGYTGHHWLYTYYARLYTVGCVFESCEADALATSGGSAHPGYVRHMHIWAQMKASVALSVTYDFCTLMSGELYHDAGYPITIDAGSDSTHIVDMYTTEAIANAGTNTKIVACGKNDFITESTGVTALDYKKYSTISFTPNSSRTLTASVPQAGTVVYLKISTSGTTSYTMTFGSGFKTTGTLATGTTSSRTFMLCFVSNGTNLYEVSRTAAYAT